MGKGPWVEKAQEPLQIWCGGAIGVGGLLSIGSSLNAWPLSLQTCAASPGECAWVSDIVAVGSESCFTTDWSGGFG